MQTRAPLGWLGCTALHCASPMFGLPVLHQLLLVVPQAVGRSVQTQYYTSCVQDWQLAYAVLHAIATASHLLCAALGALRALDQIDHMAAVSAAGRFLLWWPWTVACMLHCRDVACRTARCGCCTGTAQAALCTASRAVLCCQLPWRYGALLKACYTTGWP